MKIIFILLLFFSFFIYGSEYNNEIGFDIGIAISPSLTMGCDCMSYGDISYKWDTDIVFYHNFKLSSKSYWVLGFSYGYGLIQVKRTTYSRKEDKKYSEKYNHIYSFHKIKTSFLYRKKFFSKPYLSIGLFLDTYLTSTKYLSIVNPLGLILGIKSKTTKNITTEITLELGRIMKLSNTIIKGYANFYLRFMYSF